MKKLSLAILLFCNLTLCALGQDPQKQLSKDFTDFFVGQWFGNGEFWNGKKISADISITPSLDKQWLTYHHKDQSPNKYESIAMWGVDKQTGEFLAYTFDNFQGHRKFTGEGWKNNKLVISIKSTNPKGTMHERFTYEKLTNDSFKMTYEVGRDNPDGTVTWRMGDFLTFARKKAS